MTAAFDDVGKSMLHHFKGATTVVLLTGPFVYIVVMETLLKLFSYQPLNSQFKVSYLELLQSI